MTRPKKIFWISAASLGALALGLSFFFAFRPKKSSGEITALQVQRGDLLLTVSATGTVQPQNRLEIKPPMEGRLEEVLVEEGDTVSKGQILAWMSSSERAALLDTARSQGSNELSRWEKMVKATPILTALGGTIINRAKENGQSVSTGEAVLVVADRLIIRVQVDETDIGKLKLGQRAHVNLDAYPKNTFGGKIDHIAWEATQVNNVTMYVVDVLPVDPPPLMRSGMTANVLFEVDRRDQVLVVPTAALISRSNFTAVLQKDTNAGRLRPHRVKTGLSDGRQTEIVDGLEEGDTFYQTAGGWTPGPRRSSSGSPFVPGGSGRAPRGGPP